MLARLDEPKTRLCNKDLAILKYGTYLKQVSQVLLSCNPSGMDLEYSGTPKSELVWILAFHCRQALKLILQPEQLHQIGSHHRLKL